jgi:hypothetical protein
MAEAMHIRAASFPLVVRMSAPRWLVFVALAGWAILAGPAHAQPLANTGDLPGFDSRSSIVASDHSPSLQPTDRRHDASTRDGNPTQLATGSIATAPVGLSAIHLAKLFFDASAARQPRSPAQPRAPPAGASALTD